MKKLLFFVSVIGLATSQAQILNPGFESVTGTKPDNYNLLVDGYNTYHIKDTSNSHSGVHAAYIKGLTAQSYSVQGAVLGVFPAAGKPVAMTAWYKCNIMPGDSLVFNPYVYVTNVNSPAAKAYDFVLSSTSVYKQITATFNYMGFPSSTVGTVYTGIYLSGQDIDGEGVRIPKTGTWAIIDDLDLPQPLVISIESFNGNSTIEQVYPQPCTNIANLVYTLNENSNTTLILTDVTGKQVQQVIQNEKQTPGRYKAEIFMETLSPGIYFATLKTGSETRVSKIVKQ